MASAQAEAIAEAVVAGSAEAVEEAADDAADEAADAAEHVERGITEAIAAKTVTYDLHRLMEGATKVKTSEFAEEIINHMTD